MAISKSAKIMAEIEKVKAKIPGLQIPQKLRRVLGKGDKVGGKNIHVVPGADGFFLLLHFHLVNVRDFPLDGLYRLCGVVPLRRALQALLGVPPRRVGVYHVIFTDSHTPFPPAATAARACVMRSVAGP